DREGLVAASGDHFDGRVVGSVAQGRRYGGLAVYGIAEGNDRPVVLERSGVPPAGGDGHHVAESAGVDLAISIVPPGGDGAIGVEGETVKTPAGDSDDVAQPAGNDAFS